MLRFCDIITKYCIYNITYYRKKNRQNNFSFGQTMVDVELNVTRSLDRLPRSRPSTWRIMGGKIIE